ncbi:MAG: IS21 family transposase [Syntrophales bacterium]|nr:IS21 family transposase [Syntrophales bacterium]
MITVDQYNYIRTAHRVYGKKIRAIARDTGHSRNTVRKALSKELCDYSARKDQPYPALGPYLDIIDRWLKGDKDNPKKQRHTAKRIYSRLCYEHGFEGSDRTVRKYVHDARRLLGLDNSLVFIPLDPEPGLEAEVDWGTSHAILAGEHVKLKMFCMRSKGSGKHFVQCFPCERQQALFEGHIQAFDFFGGVFSTLIYDNLTTAVDKVLRGRDRKINESFLKFQAYYNFTPRFCNPAQGHEKGGVEGLVGYARRNYMVPVPEAQSLEELNRRLLDECMAYGNHRMSGREETVNELYEKEKQHLLLIPEVRFSNIETFSGKVDKYSTMIMDKNRYSVPTRYAGLKVQAITCVDRMDIFHGSRKIAAHRRLYGNNKWQLDPFHYLELISQRPQAFESARPIRQWRKVWPECLEQILERFCEKQGHTSGTKDFVNVLMLFKEHKKEDVVSAVEGALSAGVSSSEAVEHILISRIAPVEYSPVPLNNWETLPPPDVSVYSRIGGAL